MARFIEYQQHRWRFVDLARSHHISPGALYHRLERFGETATGIARALATGIMSREQAGKRGKENNRFYCNRGYCKD